MEIGSEFWFDNKYKPDQSEQFYMSGRSALNAIVLDAKKRYNIQRALLPSYCCDSIIMPFIKNSISVRFYDVFLDSDLKISALIPAAEENEALFLMHFFGAKINNIKINGELHDWAAVIEDKTHSFFSDLCFDIDPHYSFVSFRKWFSVTGIAIANSRYGNMQLLDKTNREFVRLRNEAFEEKTRYINGELSDKDLFLDKFRQAELMLDEDYSCYQPDIKDFSRLHNNMLNRNAIVSARRSNALKLINGLNDIDQLTVIVDFDLNNDCPLFVPVIETSGKRNELRKHLIDNNIYCPVHWPVSMYHKGINHAVEEIYNSELSLVCDQRYTVDDMERMINCIKQFYLNCK